MFVDVKSVLCRVLVVAMVLVITIPRTVTIPRNATTPAKFCVATPVLFQAQHVLTTVNAATAVGTWATTGSHRCVYLILRAYMVFRPGLPTVTATFRTTRCSMFDECFVCVLRRFSGFQTMWCGTGVAVGIIWIVF